MIAVGAPRVGLLCLSVVVLGCAGDEADVDPNQLRLQVVRAPGATSIPGQAFDSVIVQVVNQFDAGVPGIELSWSGDGEIDPETSVSDATGRVVTSWRLPRSTEVFTWFTGPPADYRLRAQMSAGQSLEIGTDARAFRADQVDASFGIGCAVRAGELWCWGYGLRAMFPVLSGPVPQRIAIPGNASIEEVRVSDLTVCARTQGGVPTCTGLSTSQQFVTVSSVPPLVDLVTAGDRFCGHAADRTIWCWTVAGPVAFSAAQVSLQPFAQLAGGGSEGASSHACALTTDGEAWCWGSNTGGQLGNGTTTPSEVPVPVAGGLRFIDIGASAAGTCGLTSEQPCGVGAVA